MHTKWGYKTNTAHIRLYAEDVPKVVQEQQKKIFELKEQVAKLKVDRQMKKINKPPFQWFIAE